MIGSPRVFEFVYTAYDMTPLARDLGDEGEPFRWDEDRRALSVLIQSVGEGCL
jgi:hypothetical protein